MTDQQISDLFAEGTAPESDPAFALSVAAGIGRARRRRRFFTVALPAAVVLALSGAAFVAAGLIGPVLAPLLDGAPQFKGVPVPVLLVAIAAGLALKARRRLLSTGAGAGALELID